MKRRPSIGYSKNGNNNFSIGGQETDQHSGVFVIELDEQITIEENKQMNAQGLFVQNGFFIINGQLIHN